jgi:hypothetical protein
MVCAGSSGNAVKEPKRVACLQSNFVGIAAWKSVVCEQRCVASYRDSSDAIAKSGPPVVSVCASDMQDAVHRNSKEKLQ